jgi:hypothetical protein
LLCKSPRYDIHETGRLHIARHAIELGKKLDSVPGEDESTIYFCEDCGFSGNGDGVFALVMLRGETVGGLPSELPDNPAQ